MDDLLAPSKQAERNTAFAKPLLDMKPSYFACCLQPAGEFGSCEPADAPHRTAIGEPVVTNLPMTAHCACYVSSHLIGNMTLEQRDDATPFNSCSHQHRVTLRSKVAPTASPKRINSVQETNTLSLFNKFMVSLSRLFLLRGEQNQQ